MPNFGGMCPAVTTIITLLHDFAKIEEVSLTALKQNQDLRMALVSGGEPGDARTETVPASAFASFVGSCLSLKAALGPFLGSAVKETELYKLKKQLDPISFEHDYEDHLSRFAVGTRQWVFERFEGWSTDPEGSRVLWVNGAGGMGKVGIFLCSLAQSECLSSSLS